MYVHSSLPIVRVYRGTGFVGVELRSMAVVSCYFSPNGELGDFEDLLANMDACLKSLRVPAILGGDLNAKTPVIGSNTSNDRGKTLGRLA